MMKKPSKLTIPEKILPRRTCIGCRQIQGKREMIRLVRIPGGTIEIDITGKKNGRGAYLCPDWKCWKIALSGKQLERALHSSITPDNREELATHGKELLKEITSG
jgi:predicted RNA-binding protein YlxR (DUF448 family)